MAVSGAINLYLNYLRIDTINVVVKMTSIENRAADSLRQQIRFRVQPVMIHVVCGISAPR